MECFQNDHHGVQERVKEEGKEIILKATIWLQEST